MKTGASVENSQPRLLTIGEKAVFGSRWLQAPMYAGLILAQGAYAVKFWLELVHLLGSVKTISETEIMLAVLGLIDIVMIANLMTMVIVGGYQTFVSRLYIDDHPDKPDWLTHVDAGVLKVKLATALISISSIHLLKTFINVDNVTDRAVMAQIAIHMTFVASAYALVMVERKMKQHHA